MFHKYRGRAAMVAAGLLSLTLAFTSACSSGEEEKKGEDLSAVKVGAMEKYGVGDQFKATEALSFDVLYNNHPNYPLNDQWLFWKELTARTNVTLKPIAVPLSDYEQKRGLLIGAGDAPFIIPKTYPGSESAYVASGAILPVSDYIDLMPNFKEKLAKWGVDDNVAGLKQEDGKFYLLPGIHEKPWLDYSIAVRTDILEQLKLPVPKTWDDVYTMLKAMKAAYPDSIPFSDRFSKPTPVGNLMNIVGTAYNAPGGWGYQHVNWNEQVKKFEFAGATDGYKGMLQYLAKLVKEGLLDPESFTQDDAQARQKLANGKSFVISTNAQSIVNDYRPDLAKTIPNAKITKIPTPTGPAGDIVPGTSQLENGVMITRKARDSKNFVAMMQFIDWLFYSEKGMEFAKWGVEGTTYTKDASGKRTLTKDVNFIGLNPAGAKHLQKDFGFQNGVFTYGGTTELLQSTFSAEEQEFQKVMNARKVLPVPPPKPFNDEEREMATLWETPLKDYVTQQSLRFILGQRDFGEWDAYLNELKAKNMTQYVDMVNKAYDRFKKAHG